MIELFKKLKNSEFLSFTELLKLKVILVLIFLFIFGILTIPVSIFEEFSLDIRIAGPIIFVLLFVFSIIMLLINKIRVSMHLTIYTIIGLTIYYIAISNHFYGFLLLFVTLTVMIFYQDIYTYVVYGGAITIYGIYYISIRGEFLISSSESNLFFSNSVYQIILVLFFLINLINFIISDHMYEHLNIEYLKKDRIISKYHHYCLKYLNEISEKSGQKPIYDNSMFQKAVSEIGMFITEFYESKGEDIAEVIEFYFFLHNQNTDELQNSSTIPSITKKYIVQLEKYMLNHNSEMNALMFEIGTTYRKGFEEQVNRYDFRIDHIYETTANRILALIILYRFLKSEPMLHDKWGRIEKSYTHDEIKELMQQRFMREFLSFEDIKFFLNNEEFFENYL